MARSLVLVQEWSHVFNARSGRSVDVFGDMHVTHKCKAVYWNSSCSASPLGKKFCRFQTNTYVVRGAPDHDATSHFCENYLLMNMRRCVVLHELRMRLRCSAFREIDKRLLPLTRRAPLHGSASTLPQSIPVAIVGAGPAGLTLSALLSQFGVPSILLEKSPGLPTHPQAHFINLRSMEIMRHAFGGLDRVVLARCPPRDEWR